MSDDPVWRAQVGLPRGFRQVPQTGIGTYSLTIQLTVLPPLVATPNPIYGAGTLGLAPASVDNTYLAPMLAQGLKGSLSSTPAQPEDLSVGQVTTLLGGPFLTAATGSVDNINLSPAPALTLKGNNTATTGPVLDLTTAQTNTLLGGPFLALTGGTINGTVTISPTLTVPSGATLVVNAGGTLTAAGVTNATGTLTTSGTTNMTGPVNVSGTLTTSSRVVLTGLPTSAAGLVAGQLWRNGTVINIV
jgi:hypothetical protein